MLQRSYMCFVGRTCVHVGVGTLAMLGCLKPPLQGHGSVAKVGGWEDVYLSVFHSYTKHGSIVCNVGVCVCGGGAEGA